MATLAVEMLANAQWIHLIDPIIQEAGNSVAGAMNAGKKLLVVDDEPEICRLLSRYLTQRGHTCVEAENGERAMAILQPGTFDAVITDCWMPGMGGLELLHAIKEMDPDLAVVLVTGNHDPDTASRALRLGADDLLFKPFKLAEVTLGLNRALEKRDLKLQLRSYQKSLEKMVEKRTTQIHHLLYHMIQSLVHTLEAKDPYTDGHSQRVTWLSGQLGQAAGISDQELHILHLGAMFHDLGKIGICESILTKRGPLTTAEYAQIKLHPDLGVRILQPLQELQAIFPIVRHHHERFGGNGYPAGLRGERIPLGARIVAIADAFDAMSSARTYRAPMSLPQAVACMKESAGSQFDPGLTDLFLSLTEGDLVKETMSSWFPENSTKHRFSNPATSGDALNF